MLQTAQECRECNDQDGSLHVCSLKRRECSAVFRNKNEVIGSVQAYIDGLPIFTQAAFGWSNSEVGIMLGILGLTAPIVNTFVGSLSSFFPDRYITVRDFSLLCWPKHLKGL